MPDKFTPQFECRRFGNVYQVVPVCFWDDARFAAEQIPADDPNIAALVDDFEKELRAVGLIGPIDSINYRMRTYNGTPLYGVRRRGHLFSPSVKAAAPAEPVPPLTEVPSQTTAAGGCQSRAESGASLDGLRLRVSPRTLIRMHKKGRRPRS